MGRALSLALLYIALGACTSLVASDQRRIIRANQREAQQQLKSIHAELRGRGEIGALLIFAPGAPVQVYLGKSLDEALVVWAAANLKSDAAAASTVAAFVYRADLGLAPTWISVAPELQRIRRYVAIESSVGRLDGEAKEAQARLAAVSEAVTAIAPRLGDLESLAIANTRMDVVQQNILTELLDQAAILRKLSNDLRSAVARDRTATSTFQGELTVALDSLKSKLDQIDSQLKRF